jgi:dolichol-phosphate mannosyltransferase
LVLSKTLSRMYSGVLSERIHTFTSCCRVYRKSAVAHLELSHGGFLGVAEMLIEIHRRGGRIVEFPATLESRLLGESKMKIVRTIGGHLGLLRTLAVARS